MSIPNYILTNRKHRQLHQVIAKNQRKKRLNMNNLHQPRHLQPQNLPKLQNSLPQQLQSQPMKSPLRPLQSQLQRPLNQPQPMKSLPQPPHNPRLLQATVVVVLKPLQLQHPLQCRLLQLQRLRVVVVAVNMV